MHQVLFFALRGSLEERGGGFSGSASHISPNRVLVGRKSQAKVSGKKNGFLKVQGALVSEHDELTGRGRAD
jgi:hypothetical protein